MESTQRSYPDRESLDRLSQMIAGARIAQIVAVAAELGIANLLKDGARTDQELAEATRTHGPSLHRLMRALAALGMVGMDGESYALTPLGSALRSDTAERLDLAARYVGNEARWRAWGHLSHSIQTGRAAFPDLFGMESWQYQELHPEFGHLFDELMTVGSRRTQEAILAAYDFSGFGTVVDIGGGHGQLLGALLQRHQAMRGVLFDRPQVVAGAVEVLAGLGVEQRCAVVGGSFFETAPPGRDVYLLKHILHDWDDDRARAILQTVCRAMAPGARVLAIERVLPEDRPPEVEAAVMDLHMLVLLQGKERTESEFRSLYERAGLRLTRVVPTESNMSLIEGVRPQAQWTPASPMDREVSLEL